MAHHKPATYETIWSAEDQADHADHEEFLSETDVDMSNEKAWRPEDARNKWTQPRGIVYQIKKHRWIIDTSLLVVIVVLLTMLLFRDPAAPEARQVGSDFTGGTQHIPTKVIKWNADEEFVPRNMTEFFSDALVAKWNTIMPAGTTTAGGPKDRDRYETTSMTHSLHCLFMMGRIYSALEGNMSHVLDTDYQSHYLHCIDYLRQAVMCAGDVALEPHAPTDGPDNGPLDGGWNGIHVCKDYRQVIGYLEHQIVDGVRFVLPIDD